MRGTCREPMRADEIEHWVVSRIRTESATGVCGRRRTAKWSTWGAPHGRVGQWEGLWDAQVARWAPWKLAE